MGITNFNVDRGSNIKYQVLTHGDDATFTDVTDLPIGTVGPNSGGVVKKVRAKCSETHTSGATTIVIEKLATAAMSSPTNTPLCSNIVITGGSTADNTWVEGTIVEAAKYVEPSQVIQITISGTHTSKTSLILEVWIEPFY